MSERPAVDLATQKRRQAVQVVLFLAGVTVATWFAFQFFHAERVAYRRGINALAAGDRAGARPWLEKAWEGGYRTPKLRLLLAEARLEAGVRREALALYEEALAATPNDTSLIDTVAGLWQAEGNPQRGLELYARLGAKETLSAPALARIGDLHQQAGDYAAALNAYRRAAELAPRDPQVLLRLGTVLAWNGQFRESAEALRAALTVQPDLRAAQLQLGRVLLWQGNFNEAVTEFRRVLPP